MNLDWQPHIVIDDFLEPQHYAEVVNCVVPETPTDDGVVIYGNIDNRLKLEHIGLHYHSKLMDCLAQLAPEKIELYEWTNIAINLTGKDCNFDIHTDHDNKLLSVVVYLEPTSTGTFLYKDQDGNGAVEVPWKTNRAFIFSKNDATWHNYKGDGKQVRRVLGINLMTNKYGW